MAWRMRLATHTLAFPVRTEMENDEMAEEKIDDRPIEKGSILPATIEDVLADVLVVCLKHGAKIYKGILLDSTKR